MLKYWYRLMIWLFPDNANNYLKFGFFLAKQGKAEEAREVLARGARRILNLLNNLGCYALNEYKQDTLEEEKDEDLLRLAQRSFALIATLAADQEIFVNNLIESLLVNENDVRDGLNFLSELKEKYPDDAEITLQIALVLFRLKDLAGAEKYFEETKELVLKNEENEEEVIKKTLGSFIPIICQQISKEDFILQLLEYLRLKDSVNYQIVLFLLKELAKDKPDNADIMLQIAMTLVALGKHEEAESCLISLGVLLRQGEKDEKAFIKHMLAYSWLEGYRGKTTEQLKKWNMAMGWAYNASTGKKKEFQDLMALIVQELKAICPDQIDAQSFMYDAERSFAEIEKQKEAEDAKKSFLGRWIVMRNKVKALILAGSFEKADQNLKVIVEQIDAYLEQNHFAEEVFTLRLQALLTLGVALYLQDRDYEPIFRAAIKSSYQASKGNVDLALRLLKDADVQVAQQYPDEFKEGVLRKPSDYEELLNELKDSEDPAANPTKEKF